jgi:signal peptidase II
MIDRVSNSYVVDFLYFSLIDFPIFNVADCYVTVGAVLMVVLLLFYYREEELGFLKPGKKEKQ